VKKLLVVNCAALGADLARRADFDRFGRVLEVEPVFPALTIPAQATLLTGLKPADHGAVGNGFFDRDMRKTFFWEQAASLVSGKRIWERIEEEHAEAVQVGLLFFQNSIGVNADAVVTPAPLHAPDGRTISACYTRPPHLAAALDRALGEFPLHHYWGPMAGKTSSMWITEATALVVEAGPLQLVFTYLPHLDYDLQRFGPESPEAGAALADLSAMVEQLCLLAEEHGYLPVILGDYAIESAGGFARPNLALREAGLLGVRRVGPYELADLGGSSAFALVDHQVAHVYCQNGLCPQEAADVLDGLAGVGRVLDREAQKGLGVDHPRGGDLILEASPGDWFAYDWWTDEDCAPPYARTVDIHNKPGYDPLELFLAEGGKGTARDGNLLKGTHGRAGGGTAALILPGKVDGPDRMLAATEVCGLLCELAAG
jgi:hypothetical protein